MSECRICKERGRAGVMIAWDNTIKNEKGGFIPLELDKKTKHKHFDAQNKLPEPNDYPNPITEPTKPDTPKLDLNNLAVIKLIAAALNEYIAIKEGGLVS